MSSLSDRLLGAVTWRSGAIGLAGFKMLEASIKQMCVAASSVVIPQVNEKIHRSREATARKQTKKAQTLRAHEVAPATSEALPTR